MSLGCHFPVLLRLLLPLTSDLTKNKKHTEKKGAISGKVCRLYTSLMTPVFISVMRHFFHFHSRLLEASNCKRWDLHEY